jgi:hypothetical protein
MASSKIQKLEPKQESKLKRVEASTIEKILRQTTSESRYNERLEQEAKLRSKPLNLSLF